MSKAIIGEVNYLSFPGMCPHEVVCHDGDEALVVLTQAVEDVLLHDVIELTAFIEYEVDRFHFLFTVIIR